MDRILKMVKEQKAFKESVTEQKKIRLNTLDYFLRHNKRLDNMTRYRERFKKFHFS